MPNTSKWSKYKALRRHAELRPVLPETEWMKEASLRRMLGKYPKVVIKPTHKWGGQGILFVSRLDDGSYEVQTDNKTKKLSTLQATYAYINKVKLSPWYIVQQYIPLATVDKRPFDIRVMVQRRHGGGSWTVTGKLAKIAGSGYQVTNARRSRGTVATVKSAFGRSSVNDTVSFEHLEKELDDYALRIARKLQLAYPGIRTMGLDMGIGTDGGVWLIEANFTPMLGLFRQLKDRRMYRTIMAFQTSKATP
ncbi:YheC/YheD family protein [Paenibacillus chartarius]|uniref:YheC/YheD family protein n=1 Tax=Paenibacillus chartarius TaxID=747481 RepID=A0ABV6DEG3_9BACL